MTDIKLYPPLLSEPDDSNISHASATHTHTETQPHSNSCFITCTPRTNNFNVVYTSDPTSTIQSNAALSFTSSAINQPVLISNLPVQRPDIGRIPRMWETRLVLVWIRSQRSSGKRKGKGGRALWNGRQNTANDEGNISTGRVENDSVPHPVRLYVTSLISPLENT